MNNWRHRAKCRSEDPELFFPGGQGQEFTQQIKTALAVCGGCPVRVDCLEWSVTVGQEAGIWGGKTEQERREMRRRRLAGRRSA